MNKQIIYLDYAATTPPAPEVVEYMMLGLNKAWGNASSEHILGHNGQHHIQESIQNIADFLQVDPACLTLTSGTTESINLALKGVMRAQNKKHCIVMTTEHKATLNTAHALAREGYHITFLAPNEDGRITAKMFEASITSDTALISMLWVNNETGEIYDVEGVSNIARAHNIIFHVDASQAMPHFSIDVNVADLISFTAHKIYGPKGVGVLYKRGFPKLPLMPVLDGAKTVLGNHVGTLVNHQVMGLARAIRLLPNHYDKEQEQDKRRLAYLLSMLAPFGVSRNGKEERLTPAIINLHVPNVYAETLMKSVEHLCFSRGSACNSDETLPSHVLTELGYSDKHARESIRISLGRYLTEFDFKRAVNDLVGAIQRLQQIANGEVGMALLPVVIEKGRDIQLNLLEQQSFPITHQFNLERSDIVLHMKIHLDADKVQKLALGLQGTPFILWMMNEAAPHLRHQSVEFWENFRVKDLTCYKNAPPNELRLVMIVEKFIRDAGLAMKI